MILIPSWVTTEDGKEAIGPELPIQTEMRILSSVDQKPRVRMIVCLQRHWVSDARYARYASSPVFGTI